MKVLQDTLQEDWLLRLNIGIVAFIELILDGFLISVGGHSEHFSPETVVFAVRESEHAVGTYNKKVIKNQIEKPLSNDRV